MEEVINQIFDLRDKSVILSDNVSLTSEETQVRKSGKLSIEVLDRPGENFDPASLLQDSDKTSITSVTDSRISEMRESEDSSTSVGTNSENLARNEEIKEQCYWIPITVFEVFYKLIVPFVIN